MGDGSSKRGRSATDWDLLGEDRPRYGRASPYGIEAVERIGQAAYSAGTRKGRSPF